MANAAVMRTAGYENVQSLPEIWAIAAKKFADITAVHDPHVKPELKLTYAALYQQMQQFAASLHALGVQPNTTTDDEYPPRVALFSDNQPRWLIADQGIMQAGAVDVVRGSQADAEELHFILQDSGAIALILENKDLLKKLRSKLSGLPLQFIVLLSDETIDPAIDLDPLKVLNFSQFMAIGSNQTPPAPTLSRPSLATLMYTSGTSGKPKGVMLSHGNLISQVIGVTSDVVQPQPSDRVLSILPIWHCYERTFEYFIFANGCTQVYTNIRFVKKDIKEFQPNYMVGVPRLWESIYEGIQKQFRDQPASKQKLIHFFLNASAQYVKANRLAKGLDLDNLQASGIQKLIARLKAALLWIVHKLGDRIVYKKIREGTGGQVKFLVSGGGSIADHLEDFFEIVGITVLGGYGLTETSPITHVRRPERNVRGADGQPLPHTETRIVDPESRQPLPVGKQGLILIRGLQVMQGYYRNPAATQKVIDSEGWFDTGDLGVITPAQDLIITGRAKDTIVLTNGENIEPQPIEDVCLRSHFVDQIMLVGQDQRSLGALVVPNLDALKQWAAAQGLFLPDPNDNLPIPTGAREITLGSQEVLDLLRQELTREVQSRPGFRPDERIGPLRILAEPFTIENGFLTQTLKIRRNVVMERYHDMIDEMFA